MDGMSQIGMQMPYQADKMSLMGQKAADIQRMASKNTDEAKLQEAADGFEAMFVHLLLQQMRKTIPDSELIDGGQGQEIWEDMFYEEIAKCASQSESLGISEMLMQEFQKYNRNPETENTSEGQS